MNSSLSNNSGSPGEAWCPQLGVSYGLVLYTLLHCCWVTVIGTVGNSVAVWLIIRCRHTRPPVKALLLSVFVPLLLLCTVSGPLSMNQILSYLWCNPVRISAVQQKVGILLYSGTAQTALLFIAVLAVVRAAAVWSPQRCNLTRRGVGGLLVGGYTYSILTCLGLLGQVVLGHVTDDGSKHIIETIYFFFVVFLPFFVATASYVAMMVAMRRNKQRLEQHQVAGNKVLDQAARAILAVFISNVVFGLPHAVFHLTGEQPLQVSIIIHIIFSTHFVVDPVVFVWFNSSYRQQVVTAVISGVGRATRCCFPPRPHILDPADIQLAVRPQQQFSSSPKTSESNMTSGTSDA